MIDRDRQSRLGRMDTGLMTDYQRREEDLLRPCLITGRGEWIRDINSLSSSIISSKDRHSKGRGSIDSRSSHSKGMIPGSSWSFNSSSKRRQRETEGVRDHQRRVGNLRIKGEVGGYDDFPAIMCLFEVDVVAISNHCDVLT